MKSYKIDTTTDFLVLAVLHITSVFISFLFFMKFRTSFNIYLKKRFITNFPFLMDLPNPLTPLATKSFSSILQ